MSSPRLFPSLQVLAFNKAFDTYGLEELRRVIDEDEISTAQGAASNYQGMRIYRPLLNKKCQELISTILLAVVQGDLPRTEALISQEPFLSLAKGEAIDYSRRTVSDVTPFQAALCAWDNEMCDMLVKYMVPREVAHQYLEIFPKGREAYVATQTSFDFSVLVDVITQSTDVDIQAALNKQQNDSLLCQTFNQFRDAFTARSYQEKVFNPQHLIRAFEIYDLQFENWDWPKRDLFWRQVIGYVQRFLPANIAQDVAQGLSYRVENGEPARRTFNFRFGGGSIFPFTFDSHAELGFDYAGWRGNACGGTLAGRGPWEPRLTKLMSSKNNNLGKLMPQQVRNHTSCVIV